MVAGVTSLFWARDAMEGRSIGLAAAPLLAGLLMLGAGIAAAATAARRLRFFFGRGRPRSLAPDIPVGATGTSAETGPGTMPQISLMTSLKSRPDLAISDGLVVTPSRRPVA